MNQIIVQDDVELATTVNSWLQKSLLNSNQKIVQLPAGSTPQSLYRSWESLRPNYLTDVVFQQVDDVLTGSKSGCFKLFFEQHLPSYKNQFLPLSEAPIAPNIAILGVGTNGHLAFHEPEIDYSFNYGCVKLSPMTCQNLNLTYPTWGISYGAGHFLLCHSVLIIAKGKNKKNIVEKALQEVNPSSTFSYILKSHHNCTLILDQDCARYVKVNSKFLLNT